MADGVSTSDNGPVLQLGLDYEHDSGFYAGVWASNVDSDEKGTPNLELDYSIGFKHKLTDAIEGDVGITHYSWYHPDGNSDEWNYQEWYAGLTWMENTSLYYYYADDSKVWDGVQRRIIAEHVQPLPKDFSLILTAERVDLETSIAEDYSAYRIGVAKTWFDVDFTLSYWSNSIHDGDSTTKDHIVLEASKTFDLF
ncbi:MAG TPA: TorF family putative porin [Pseudomonadales bacterium]|nr:TorF family putative porin [Pseudomonadales bacterium]HNN87243.1 TorF family putative porin [Pseudomonadales bacterium]